MQRPTTILASIILLIAAVSVVAVSVTAQGISDNDKRARIGLFGNYAYGMHSASFDKLPSVSNCCPEFTSTSGSGFFLGAQFQSPLSDDFALALRAHYGTYGVDFTTTETKPILIGDQPTEALIRHDLRADFTQVSIEPLLVYRATRSLNFLGGLTLGFVLDGTYDQKETLEQPSQATFTGGSKIRNALVGDIPELSSIALGITLGVSYDLAINADRTLFLSPEVLFTFSPTGVAKDVSWNIHQLRAGLAVNFIPPDVVDTLTDVELLEAARGIDPPTRAGGNIPFTASVSATGLKEDGRLAPITSVRVEEFASTRVRPLLPYVFFEKNSSDMPVRYRKLSSEQRDAFTEKNFYNLDALVTYYHLLNLLGKRLNENPTASITLTGCTDADEAGQGALLAQQRADAVKDYLTDTWGIAGSRITVVTRALPESPSNSAEADGRAENRRVEIATTSTSLLAPVMSNDTMRTFDPAGVRFIPSIDPRVPIASYTLFVTEGDRIIKTFHNGDPIPASLDWRVEEQSRFLPREARELKYLLVVRDSTGLVIPSATQSIAISQVLIEDKRATGGTDKTIDRYSLILFGFDQSDLNPANIALVADVKQKIQPNSTVRVVGYTDRIGSDDYNQKLSEQRARAVSRALGVPEGNAYGMGERFQLYDNATPEARFYSRTVEVFVDTPLR